MTCNSCVHSKVCAYRTSSRHITNVESHCNHFQDIDRVTTFPVAVGEPVWIFECDRRDRIEEATVYKIRATVECESDYIVKSKTDTCLQIFAITDSGRCIEILPKYIGRTAFLTFEDAEKAAINTDGSTEQIRFQMFRDYLHELQEIEEYRYMTDEEILDNFVKMRSGKTEAWRDIYPDNSKQTKHDIIGFWIMGINGNCHPNADIYIAEAYIKPEYRREGIMSDRISDWIKKYGGKFCLFILSKNEVAKKFWLTLFERCGYEQYQLSKATDDMDGHLVQYGFKPKEATP